MRNAMVCLAALLGAMAPHVRCVAQGSTGPSQIQALEAEQAYIRDLLKRTESGSAFVISATVPHEGGEVSVPTVVSKDWLVAMLTVRMIEGNFTPAQLASMLAGLRQSQAQRRAALEKRLVSIAALIAKARTGRRPSGPREKGFWRLKAGYPRLNPNSKTWVTAYGKHTRVECDISEGSVTWHSTSRHAQTGAVTHEYTCDFTVTRMPTTIESGQEFTVQLGASCAYQKDGGFYTGEDGVLDWTGFRFTSATAQMKGLPGSRSARVRVGLWGKKILSDSRTVKLVAPAAGNEVVLTFGLYGRGEMIRWVWEWVGL